MIFGGQTVTFVTVAEDPTNRDRYNAPQKIRTTVDVRGCRFRPLTTSEKILLGDIVDDPWKCTAPPVPAALNAKSTDEVIVAGITYQIIGVVRTFPDMSGHPYKVTIMCGRRPS